MNKIIDPVFTRLYLIRHGQTDWNKEKMIQGVLNNIPLNVTGTKQAKALSKRMKDEYQVDVIYASTAKRAQQTAEEINANFNVGLHINANLNEVDFGAFSGHSIHDIENKFSDYFSKFRHFIMTNRKEDTPRPTLPNGESIQQIEKRVTEFVNSILKNNTGKHVAVVSHGSFLKCMMTYFSGGSLHNYMPYWVENASISVVDFFGDLPIIRRLNDTSHLNTSLDFVVPRII